MDERLTSDLKSQLRQQVEDEFAKRTNEHRVKVHTIKRVGVLDKAASLRQRRFRWTS
jgi:hypothetical protein